MRGDDALRIDCEAARRTGIVIVSAFAFGTGIRECRPVYPPHPPFDEAAALIWAGLMAEGSLTRRPRVALDMIIAAIAEANDCVVVADNEKDLVGLKIVNPLRAAT
jgi:hypothetical protein